MKILVQMLIWIVLGIVLASPVAVGVFPIYPTVLVLSILFLFCVYAFTSTSSNSGNKRIALVLLSVSFAISLTDLVARPLLPKLWTERPSEVFAHSRPELPVLDRFSNNVNFRGATFGDLAALSGRKEWREGRAMTFLTDANGFRNSPAAQDNRPLDLIVLGDSFGVGVGASQERIWPGILANERGLAVYNLSMDGASPWQEYANLLIESQNLKTRDGTTVLWLLFTGNDLTEFFYPAFRREDLPWLRPLGILMNRIRTFRYQSPIRKALILRGRHPERDSVVARPLPDGRTLLFFRPYIQLAALPLEAVTHHENYENLRATFAAMKKLTDERHLRLVVAVAPAKEEIYDWVLNQQQLPSAVNNASGFAAAMKNLSGEHGVAFLDLKPALVDASRKAYQRGELLWWRDDTHWNDAGHRVVASILYETFLQPPPAPGPAVSRTSIH